MEKHGSRAAAPARTLSSLWRLPPFKMRHHFESRLKRFKRVLLVVVVMEQSSPIIPELIYHIALPEHLEQAKAAGVYTMSTRDVTIAQEGYMHASFERQVDATLQRFYRDVPSACVLVIDASRVVAAGLRLVVEQLGRAPQTLYNRLNILRRSLAECVERRLAEGTVGSG